MSVLKSPASRTALVVACAALLLIWSMLSLDLQTLRLTTETTLSEATVPQIVNLSTEFFLRTAHTPPDRPLILYAYSESGTARVNLRFFVYHGLHGAADFIFILNGKTNAAEMIPKKENIRVIQRPNDCYDLGAYAEVLTTDDLYKKYNRFIMLNASIRGPFMPYHSESCWSDMYLRKITDKVKLVGMTANCWPKFHVQSMIWATDSLGLATILTPPDALIFSAPLIPVPNSDNPNDTFIPTSINSCFHSWGTAVRAEISASTLIKAAGYEVDALMTAYHGIVGYEESCNASEGNGDVLWDGGYFGGNLHPFETGFMKTNRDFNAVTEKHTEWVRGRGYSSWDVCGVGS